MFTKTKEDLESLILEHLTGGPLSTIELLARVKDRRPTTKQGFYRAIRNLVKAEALIKHGSWLSINTAWLEKIEDFVRKVDAAYSFSIHSGKFLPLQDGERISYEFRSLNSADTFWNHATRLLIKEYPRMPWFAYNPHCWFFLARAESERALRDFIVKMGGQYLLTVGGTTPLDKAIRNEFDDKTSQYHLLPNPLFKKHNYYLNILGEYLVEVWIDIDQQEAIDAIYAAAPQKTSEIVSQLQKVLNAKGRARLVISHDRRKAQKLSESLSKAFYILKQK